MGERAFLISCQSECDMNGDIVQVSHLITYHRYL